MERIAAALGWLVRLAVRRESYIYRLLEEDKRAPEMVEQVLAKVDPWAPLALHELAGIYERLFKCTDGGEQQRRVEAALDAHAANLGLPRSELRERIASPDSTPEVVAARAVYLPFHAAEMGTVLSVLCGRYFRWLATDLLRGRVTSAIGYARLQAEAVGLIHLIQRQPEEAAPWFAAGVSGDGKAFFRRTQKHLNRILTELNLADAYEWGSSNALHVRVFPVLRGHVLEPQDDGRPYLWLKDHEVSVEEPFRFVESFTKILVIQAHVLHGLRISRTEVDTTDVAKRIAEYVGRTRRIAAIVERMQDEHHRSAG